MSLSIPVVSDPNVSYVVNTLTAVSNGNLNHANLASVVIQGVLTMDNFRAMTADQRKLTLVSAMNVMIQNTSLPQGEKDGLQLITDNMVAPMIDGFVGFATGVYNLSAHKCSMLSCFRTPTNPVPADAPPVVHPVVQPSIDVSIASSVPVAVTSTVAPTN